MEAYLLTRGQRFLCKNGRAIGRGDSFNLLIALENSRSFVQTHELIEKLKNI